MTAQKEAGQRARAGFTNHQVLVVSLWGVALALFVSGVSFTAGLTYPHDAPQTAPTVSSGLVYFSPPDESTIPPTPDGDAIRRGRDIFMHTRAAAGRYVGNGLSCSNCHLDAGRKDNAAPMWAAWGSYPAYRAKNGRINTMEDRIRDCFLFSMNAPSSPSGGPPAYGDDIYRDLQSYFAWLATGAPYGRKLYGRGYIQLMPAPAAYDPERGAAVFEGHCAACHGKDGQGQANSDGSYAYPPLWGPKSYNWGAGMTNVRNAAGFIAANMPLGQGYTLTAQQAWDVAAYIDSHERPRDPRQTGTIAEARASFHQRGDYYGTVIAGDLLGDGK